MLKRLTRASIVLILVLLVASPVFAYLYRAQISITEGNGTDYDMLGIRWSQSNTFMANNGYMDADALDTRVQNLGGTNYPHLVGDDKTLTASPISGNGQVNLYFVTGETPQTDMDLVMGDGGYVTTADAAALEMGNDFEIASPGWVGDDGYRVRKDGSFAIVRDGTDVSAFIEDVATFPNVSAVSSGVASPANYPAGISVGDLVIVTVSGLAASTLTIDAELTELWESGSSPRVGSYYRVVDGTEGATFTIAVDAGAFAYAAYRIDTGTYYGIPEVGTEATATSANPDSPSLTTSYGTSGNLWIAVFGSNGAIVINNWPANYAANQISSLSRVAMCSRNLAAETEDPGVWTLAAAPKWIANTIVVRSLPVYATASGVADGEHEVTARADATLLELLVGTDNLLWNSEFEEGAPPTGWTAGGTGTLTRDNAHVKVGSYAAKMVNNPVDVYYLTETYSGGHLPDPSGLIGESYTLGAWVWASNANATWLYVDDDVGGWNDGDRSSYHTGSSDWEWLTITHTIQVGATDWAAQLYIESGIGATIWVDSIKLTAGSTCTPDTYPVDTVALGGASCADNANDWLLYPDPYWSHYEHTVSGTLVVDYDPEDIISGTTLPDLEGAAQDGTITWGSNPAGISVSVGSLVSAGQGVVGEEVDTSTSDILPPAGTREWNEAPDVTGALLTNPMRPLVVAVSDNTTLSERQVWVYFGLILLLLVVAGVSRVVRGHHLITGISAAAIIIALAVMTIWPYWALVFAALAIVGGLVAERSPSL